MRSVGLLYGIFGIPLYIAKWIFNLYTIKWNPFMLLIVFRIITCAISFITDYSLYKYVCCVLNFINYLNFPIYLILEIILQFEHFFFFRICKILKVKPNRYLLLLSSSYVLIVFGTKTFTNSLELALVSLLLWQVVDSIKISEKVFTR